MKSLRLKLYVLLLVLTLASFSLSWAFSDRATFPDSVIRNLRRKISPSLQLRRETRKADLRGITAIKIKSRDVAFEIRKNPSEAETQAVFFLEGRFSSTNKDPLKFETENALMQIQIEEDLRRKAWLSDYTGQLQSTRLTLLLPQTFSGKLEIENDAGEVGLEDLKLGEFVWRSVTGSLRVSGGQIFIANLESVSGDIDYESFTPDLVLNLTSGSAVAKFPQFHDSIVAKLDLATVSGNLEVHIPKTSSLRVSLSSMTGEVESEAPLTRSREQGSGRTFEGLIGSGTGEIRLRSVSGSCRLKVL